MVVMPFHVYFCIIIWQNAIYQVKTTGPSELNQFNIRDISPRGLLIKL